MRVPKSGSPRIYADFHGLRQFLCKKSTFVSDIRGHFLVKYTHMVSGTMCVYLRRVKKRELRQPLTF